MTVIPKSPLIEIVGYADTNETLGVYAIKQEFNEKSLEGKKHQRNKISPFAFHLISLL